MHQVPGIVEEIVYNKVLAALVVGDITAAEATVTLEKGEAAYKTVALIQACAMVRHSLPAVAKAVNGP